MPAHKLNNNIEKYFKFKKPINEKTLGIDTEILHECNTCGLELDYSNFQFIQKGVNNLKKTKNSSRCKRCQNKRNKTVDKLKKIYPKQNNQKCALEGCNKLAKHLDHEEEGTRFRGWLCADHNQGYGKIGDSPESAIKFVKYDLETMGDGDRKEILKNELECILNEYF